MKHLSYAGTTLPLPTPQLEREWLSRVHPPWDFTDFDGYNFDRPTAAAVPTPPVPRPTEFRLNTLFWPTGASRPAWFHFVAETSRLEAIRAAVGNPVTAAPLVMYDGRSGKTVTASMILLADRPLNITCGDSDETYWLCTLTDVRYFWYLKRGQITAPSSWTDLFSQLGTVLGTAITVDAVDAGYGLPSPKWVTDFRTPGSLLDAAAYQVGQRVVVGLDGSVRTVNWETAQTASTLYFSTADAPISGGRVSQAGIVACAPSSVVTVFGDASGTTPYVVTKTLVGLAVPGYGAATGVLSHHGTVFGDGVYDGTNAVALDAYATAASTDWYGWNLSDPDVAWPGVEPWAPTGWEERVEWTITVRDDGPFALTTVRRGPWTEFYAGDFVNDPPDATLTVEQVDGDPPVINTVTIKFDQDDGFVVTEEAPGIARIDFVPVSTYYGCGLEVVADEVRLNLTDVVFDGLYWDNENCVLGVNFGCGLTLIGDQLAFDYTGVVGDRAETGLVVRDNPDPDCDNLAFDDTPFATTTEYRDNITGFAVVDGVLKLSYTRYTDTNHFNEQGVIINRTSDEGVNYYYVVDPCDLECLPLTITCDEVEYEFLRTYDLTFDYTPGDPHLEIDQPDGPVKLVYDGAGPDVDGWYYWYGKGLLEITSPFVCEGYGPAVMSWAMRVRCFEGVIVAEMTNSCADVDPPLPNGPWSLCGDAGLASPTYTGGIGDPGMSISEGAGCGDVCAIWTIINEPPP